MTSEHKILSASLEAMRELSIEQLREERLNIARHLQDAVAVAEAIIDHVIAEKLHARTIN